MSNYFYYLARLQAGGCSITHLYRYWDKIDPRSLEIRKWISIVLGRMLARNKVALFLT